MQKFDNRRKPPLAAPAAETPATPRFSVKLSLGAGVSRHPRIEVAVTSRDITLGMYLIRLRDNLPEDVRGVAISASVYLQETGPDGKPLQHVVKVPTPAGGFTEEWKPKRVLVPGASFTITVSRQATRHFTRDGSQSGTSPNHRDVMYPVQTRKLHPEVAARIAARFAHLVEIRECAMEPQHAMVGRPEFSIEAERGAEREWAAAVAVKPIQGVEAYTLDDAPDMVVLRENRFRRDWVKSNYGSLADLERDAADSFEGEAVVAGLPDIGGLGG